MSFWIPQLSLLDGKYLDAEVEHGFGIPAAEAVDLQVHLLRAWELPYSQCMLAIAASHHLKFPYSATRLDIDAVHFHCRLFHHDLS